MAKDSIEKNIETNKETEISIDIDALRKIHEIENDFFTGEIDFIKSLDINTESRILIPDISTSFPVSEFISSFPDADVSAFTSDKALSQLLTDLKENQGLDRFTVIQNWQENSGESSEESDEYDLIFIRESLFEKANPAEYLLSVKNLLKAGGMIVLSENDNAFMSLYPQPKGFSKIYEKSLEYCEKNNIDPFIGRKLFHSLTHAGFSNVKADLINLTSQNISKSNLLEKIITPYIKAFEKLAGSKYEAQAIKDNIIKLKDDSDSFITMTKFIAAGKNQ